MLVHMMSDDILQIRDFVRTTQKVAVFCGFVLGLGFLVFWSRHIAFGFIAGVTVSVVNFQLMAADSYELIGKKPQKARRFIISRYLVRYIIMFVFIALVVTRTDFNIIAAFSGLLFVQMVLVFGRLLQTTDSDSKIREGFQK